MAFQLPLPQLTKHTDCWRLAVVAGDLAIKLGSVAAMHPAVRIGSYPNVAWESDASSVPWRVKLQFESRDAAALERAVEAAVSSLPDTFELSAQAA